MKLLSERNDLIENLLVAGLLLAVSLFSSAGTFDYWFFCDDPAAIAYSTASLKSILFLNTYSYAFYTPLVALSFKPDVLLFGMNPFPYHVHNAIVLAFCGFFCYLILKRYADRTSSLLSAVIVLVATPSLLCVIWITLRQYLYAMLCALIAIWLFLKYRPTLKEKKIVTFVILLLCESSFMGKEQFMSLPFVLFLLAEGGCRARLQKTYPYFLLVLAHFFVRWHVLGSTGGYLAVSYHPAAYLRTTLESIFATSRIVFGLSWVIIIVALPSLLKPSRMIRQLLVWMAALSISFLQMGLFPSADTYRYWFVPVMLVSFFIGLNASLIRNRLVKALYCLMVVVLFLHQNTGVNADMKALFGRESAVAEKVSECMFDKKYGHALFLCPDDPYIIESSYIYYMAKAYFSVLGVQARASFYPLALLTFYPQIASDFEKVFEIRGTEAVDVTDSLNGMMAIFRTSLSDNRPETGLLRNKQNLQVSLKCRSGSTISVFSFRKLAGRYYAMEDILPYLELVSLGPFTKSDDVELVPIEKLSYRNNMWLLGEKSIPAGTVAFVVLCTDVLGKNSRLSDVLYVPHPRR